jgi:hypothetical protein
MNAVMILAGSGSNEANGFGCFCVGAVFFLVLALWAKSRENNNHRR